MDFEVEPERFALSHPAVTDNVNASVSSKTLSKQKSLLLIIGVTPKSTQAAPTQTERESGERTAEILGVSPEGTVNTREGRSSVDTAVPCGAGGPVSNRGLLRPRGSEGGVGGDQCGRDSRTA